MKLTTNKTIGATKAHPTMFRFMFFFFFGAGGRVATGWSGSAFGLIGNSCRSVCISIPHFPQVQKSGSGTQAYHFTVESYFAD